jgi:hypothetical protein
MAIQMLAHGSEHGRILGGMPDAIENCDVTDEPAPV